MNQETANLVTCWPEILLSGDRLARLKYSLW